MNVASEARRLSTNVAGELFVDDSCIDCGACRWIAPDNFDDASGHSRVFHQPNSEPQRDRSFLALVACPTGSIGATSADAKAATKRAARQFPNRIAAGVYHCGYHSDKSFGAASYLITRPGGNVLVDSPRYNAGLVKRIEALGGVATMVLSHRDDVADHQRFAERFGCERVLWRDDVSAKTQDVEVQPSGAEPYALAPDLLLIPTPGHTRGSACLLYRDTFLFSGDHVAFHRKRGQVYAFSGACWYDWPTQIRSMQRLLDYRFTHILPGHGAPCQFSEQEMQQQMRACVEWMKRQR